MVCHFGSDIPLEKPKSYICLLDFKKKKKKKGKENTQKNNIPPNVKPLYFFSVKASENTCSVFWKSFHKCKIEGRCIIWKSCLETDENIGLFFHVMFSGII